MKNPYDIINSLIFTEKSQRNESLNKYVFWVKNTANKIDIKNAVEKIYKVDVVKVNTMVCPGKAKTVRRERGYTPDWKKAQVTLKAGQKIEIK